MGPTESMFGALRGCGWLIERPASPWNLPGVVRDRYNWLWGSLLGELANLSRASSPDDMVWLNTGADFCGEGDGAFAWNEWEKMSIDAADGDLVLVGEIRAFWDAHFPVLNSVRDGYAYLALARGSQSVVFGREPEFEDCLVVAPSMSDAIAEIVSKESQRDGWAGLFAA